MPPVGLTVSKLADTPALRVVSLLSKSRAIEPLTPSEV